MTMPLERIKGLVKPHYDWMPGEMGSTRYGYWNLSDTEVIDLAKSAILHLREGVSFTEEEIASIRHCLSSRIGHLRLQGRESIWGDPGPGIYWQDIRRLERTLEDFNRTLSPPPVVQEPSSNPQLEPVHRSFLSRLLRRSTSAGASL